MKDRFEKYAKLKFLKLWFLIVVLGSIIFLIYFCDASMCIENESNETAFKSSVFASVTQESKSFSELEFTTIFKRDVCINCSQNQYCAKSNEIVPMCICSRGYNGSDCSKQVLCNDGYVPFTNISNNSIPISRKDYENLKTLCCPTHNISNKCCGRSSNDMKSSKFVKITQGLPSSLGKWPWIVDVSQVYKNGSNYLIITNCSGALITEFHVLTAAHCVTIDEQTPLGNEFNTLESMVRVHFGFIDKSIYYSNDLFKHERNVTSVEIHDSYDRSYYYNDIAILVLNKPIEKSKFVDYICLFNYTLDDNLVYDKKLYVAGWGLTSYDKEKGIISPYPNLLQDVDLEIQGISECYYIIKDIDENNSNVEVYFDTSKQICAGYKVNNNQTNKDTCNSDSGSPLMVKLNGQWFIYGITSYGSVNRCGKGPAIYTRIAAYYDWIKNKTDFISNLQK